MSNRSKMHNPKKWKRMSDQSILYEGQLIKGFTYNPGDYHYKQGIISNKLLGDAKLRVGVIIKKYSNNVFKVQFRNSAAKSPSKINVANKIEVFNNNNNVLTVIEGTDSYCMFIERKKIKLVFKPQTHINNLEKLNDSIYKKHHKNKKRVQKKIESGFLDGKTKKEIKSIFNNDQFTYDEKNLSPNKALEKINLILTRHSETKTNLKMECVYKERSKVASAEIWAEELIKNIKNLKREINHFIFEASVEETAVEFIEFVKKRAKEKKVSQTVAVLIGKVSRKTKPLDLVKEILITSNEDEEILKLLYDHWMYTFKKRKIAWYGVGITTSFVDQKIAISDSKLPKLFKKKKNSKNTTKIN